VDWLAGEGWALAYGRPHGYLVATGSVDVRLARINILVAEGGDAARLALGVMRTGIVIPAWSHEAGDGS
jgi:hypothetical protein